VFHRVLVVLMCITRAKSMQFPDDAEIANEMPLRPVEARPMHHLSDEARRLFHAGMEVGMWFRLQRLVAPNHL